MHAALPYGIGGDAMLGMVAVLWAAAVITPGPNLLAVLSASTKSRRSALLTVAGVATGTACWGLAGSFGMQALFAAAPWLFIGLKLVGGAYLVFIGARLLYAAARGGVTAALASPRGRPLGAGLATSLSNPKSALLVASLFAATQPASVPLAFGLKATAVMVGVAVAWYGTVAWVASSRTVVGVLGKARRWIDLVAGAAFTGFGTRLLWAAR